MPMDHPTAISFPFDALYCDEEEEKWGETEGDFADSPVTDLIIADETNPLSDDDELLTLLSKEKETHFAVWSSTIEAEDSFLSAARWEAAGWILKVSGYYGFSTLTAILAINYLHRFLASVHYQKDKPWMIHLASVTCLSLAAKVEETHAPLLLDLQVDTKYMFEAKTIQKMELLILSMLEWRMNLVTPLSFFDHIMRRLRLNNHLPWDFLRRCERLLLSVVADCRVIRYEASVLAIATMLHVINEVEACNAIDYQTQLLHILKICKMKVKECCELISEVASAKTGNEGGQNKPLKRKSYHVPNSPDGVIEAFLVSSDGSNDSWTVESSVSSPVPPKKKIRSHEQQMRSSSLPLNRVFLEVVGSPR